MISKNMKPLVCIVSIKILDRKHIKACIKWNIDAILDVLTCICSEDKLRLRVDIFNLNHWINRCLLKEIKISPLNYFD